MKIIKFILRDIGIVLALFAFTFAFITIIPLTQGYQYMKRKYHIYKSRKYSEVKPTTWHFQHITTKSLGTIIICSN